MSDQQRNDDDRWERLFADLESRTLDDGGVSDLVDAERVGVTLHDRVRAAIGTEIFVRAGGTDFRGTLLGIGKDWLRIGRSDVNVIVRIEAISRVSTLGARSPREGIEQSITSVFRGLARSGANLVCRSGDEEIVGRIIAVAADHIELRTETGDSVLPINAIAYVRAPRAAFD